jgi:hypothetical protein
MKKEIKQETINKYIWDWVRYNYSNEIKEYKEHIKEYGFKINLKQEIIETINNGYDGKTFYQELLNGSDENENHINDRVTMFGDYVEEEDDYDLIQFISKEEEMFYNDENYDNDWIIENIMYFFKWDKKDYDKYTSYCDSHQGSLNLNTNGLEGVEQFENKYKTKADIEEHLEYNLDFYEVMNIILLEHFKGFGLDYKETIKDITNTLKYVKEELNKRLIEHKKEKNKILKELKLIDCNNDYLVGLIESDLNAINNHIRNIEDSLK